MEIIFVLLLLYSAPYLLLTLWHFLLQWFCNSLEKYHHIFSKAQVDVSKLLVWSDNISKAPKYLIYNDVKLKSVKYLHLRN